MNIVNYKIVKYFTFIEMKQQQLIEIYKRKVLIETLLVFNALIFLLKNRYVKYNQKTFL
jgi:hypothetical protein